MKATPGHELARPFPGPRPFRRVERDLLYGRDREVNDLCDLVSVYQSALLYAQSGAGKTSLVNAKLQPLLEEKLQWRVFRTRVIGEGHEPGEELVAAPGFNRFSYHTLRGSWDRDTDPRRLAECTISESLAGQPKVPTLLILDQIEDLFLRYARDWEHRRLFLVQLADAMEAAPHFHVLLVIREDFLARLESHAIVFRNGFNIRYRLERLRDAAASQAIKEPLRAFGMEIDEVADRVVERIVATLKTSTDPDGVPVVNEWIEPLELQIVCDQLWDSIARSRRFEMANVENHVDVNAAMRAFYDRVVAKAAREQHVSQARIREWCEKQLISDSGTRDLVFLGASAVARLPNRVIDALAWENLLQIENLDNRVYCELPHDRFIDAIRRSNAQWWRRRFVIKYWKLEVMIAIMLVALIGSILGYKLIDERYVERAQAQKTADQIARQLEDVRARMEHAEQSRDAQVKTLEVQKRALEARASEISSRLDQLNREYAATTNKAGQEALRLSKAISSLRQESMSLGDLTKTLVAQSDATAKRAQELQGKLEKTQTELTRVQTELDSRRQDLEQQLTTCRNQISVLNSDLTTSEGARTSCDSTNATTQAGLATTQAKLATIQAKITACTSCSNYLTDPNAQCP